MSAALKGKRILVVDDEADVREAIADVLEGCEVALAATHEEAKAKLATGAFDAAIVDLMGVRGHDLVAAFAPRVPCIVLTAHALTPADMARARAGHAVLYLPKDELPRLPEYLAKVVTVQAFAPAGAPPDHAERHLWSWLYRRLDFRRWFGKSFDPGP